MTVWIGRLAVCLLVPFALLSGLDHLYTNEFIP